MSTKTPNLDKWLLDRHFEIGSVSFAVFWYTPTPWWKLWRGYRPCVLGNKWPTLYLGPLKIVTGPAPEKGGAK